MQAGDTVEIILELDTEDRTIEVPADLAAALSEHEVRERFDRLAYSVRKEHVRQVESAKAEQTRKRCIEKIVAACNLSTGPVFYLPQSSQMEFTNTFDYSYS
jgi:uncharacterized protein YdeI (YjbR/CyaY-like superfamily)